MDPHELLETVGWVKFHRTQVVAHHQAGARDVVAFEASLSYGRLHLVYVFNARRLARSHQADSIEGAMSWYMRELVEIGK